jgi:hypothetical protein
MSETSVSTERTPWYFWLIAVLALLWNSYGGYDYFMAHTAGDAYLATGMNPTQIEYYKAMPAWMTAAWAIGVWGAVLASLLMLFRSRWAVPVFVVSLLGLLATLLYTYVLTNGLEIMGSQAPIVSAVLTAAAVFFIWFSRRMVKRGVLH